MNERRESWLKMLAVKLLIDPMLRSSAARARLRSAAHQEHRWLRVVLRKLIDPTILPPPSYTRARADHVYGAAFRRCLEYLTRNRVTGDLLEFGTLMGYTARWWAALMREHDCEGHLWLFDSFEGLPEIAAETDRTSYEVAVNKVWFKGAMKVDAALSTRIEQSLARILAPERLHAVKGYFEETVSQSLPNRPVALVHLDCDLYASARHVLDFLLQRSQFQDGALLVVDDFNCNRANPRMGLRRALEESFAGQSRFTHSTWFSYGWHGQVFFVHDSCP